MKHGGVRIGVLVAMVVSCSCLAGTCPRGALATDSEMVLGEKFGVVAVEACVTRTGSEDTYTYRVTNLSRGPVDVCGFMVTAFGTPETVLVASPAGWAGRTTWADTGCGTWWTWSTLEGLLRTGAIGPGESQVFAVTVRGPTTPVDVRAAVGFCGGSTEGFTIVGPSGCTGGTGGAIDGCACGVRGCTAVDAFEGDGPRIRLVGGPDTQVISACEPSWVRHGWLGPGLEAGDVEFRLSIDGFAVGLNLLQACWPDIEVGVTGATLNWGKQFPAGFFSAGTHELIGEWEQYPSVEFPSGFTFARTITLIVEPCLAEPIPVPPMADLVARIGEVSCSCAWTVIQQRRCEMAVPIVVTNQGQIASDATALQLVARNWMSVKPIPELQPGASYETKARISFEIPPEGDPPCPLDVEVIVDYADFIQEADESNNRSETEVCCRE